ncbi:hypothetical protein [Streptomyces albidoflavus]|uniref:hypothetical protein n=1 Tax=Streptomyces albidoflavus TaxID=1886 RepID=UPI00101E5A4F|nr:hypothetical protein [Streptomyces albidoflavus]RZD89313.1 hypothetical protein C0Q60_03635 [Streptomyces albidoflavus]RZE04972.1 hypothetical protein C0Q62_03550 [Streptomyces albidoflavus]
MTLPPALAHPPLLAVGGAVALAVVLTAWVFRRRADAKKRFSSVEVKVAALAAGGATAYSADTSWAFATHYLDMTGTAERVSLFASAELSLFAMALMARRNLASSGAPGLPGTVVWVITGVQVIPAYAESGPVGGTVRAFVGPVMAAVLWHVAMGIELRLRTPGAASQGLIAVLGREGRERVLSRLGIAARDRDAAQITRDRATARAVALAARLAEWTPEQQQNWRGRRLARRLSKAVGRASVGTDPLQRAQLLDQLAARRHAFALATVPLPSPWSSAHPSAVAVSDRGGPAESESAQGQESHQGPTAHRSGTNTPEDPGPTIPRSGTSTPQDPGPTIPRSGTNTPEDPVRQVPLRQKATKPRTKTGGKRARSRSPRTRVAELGEAERQLVREIRPHIPALLARDGNASITRVQLREIIRREDLPGLGNDRLSPVLQELRKKDITTARSTV